jgi:hypothetical protein
MSRMYGLQKLVLNEADIADSFGTGKGCSCSHSMTATGTIIQIMYNSSRKERRNILQPTKKLISKTISQTRGNM